MFRSHPFRANGRHRRSVDPLTALAAALGVPFDGERDRTPRHRRAAVEVKLDGSPRPQHDTAIAESIGMTDFGAHTVRAMDLIASPAANAALPFPEGDR